MSLGTILLIFLIVLLFGGFAGPRISPAWQYGYGFGNNGLGVLGIVLIVVVVLVLAGRL